VRCLSVDALHALDPGQTGVDVGVSLRRGGVLPAPSSPDVGTL